MAGSDAARGRVGGRRLTGVVTATLIDQGQREAGRAQDRQAEERQAEVLRHSIDDRLTRLEDRAP